MKVSLPVLAIILLGSILFRCQAIVAEIPPATVTEDLRDEYYRANDDSDAADLFYEKMEKVPEDAPARVLGYKGIAALVEAKHSFNPINKMRYFSEGSRLLDASIEKEPSNVELRFLRFTVQDNAPFFLDYHDQLEEDKKAITTFLSDKTRVAASPSLALKISEYLKENG